MWHSRHFSAAWPPNLWQAAQLVAPFRLSCGRESGPGEICDEARDVNANRRANRRSEKKKTGLEIAPPETGGCSRLFGRFSLRFELLPVRRAFRVI